MKALRYLIAAVLAAGLLGGCMKQSPADRESPTGEESPVVREESAGEIIPPVQEAAGPGYARALVREPAAPDWDGEDVQEAYRQGLRSFSYETASMLLAEGKEGENGNYSPVSFYLSLAMLANGAEPGGQEELLDLLGAESLSGLNENSAVLLGKLLRGFEGGDLDIGNSLWMQEDSVFNRDFVDTVAEHYNAWLFAVDFPGGEGDAYGAEWIADQLRGTIEPQLTAGGDTILRIINTIYFQGGWQDAFGESNTQEMDFTLESGETVPAQLMRERHSGSYIQGDNYKAVSKALHNGYLRFVLPEEGVSVDELLADPGLLAQAMEGKDWVRADLEFALPRFAFGVRYDLTESFDQLGLSPLADPAGGLLNAMAVDPENNLYLSQAVQETFISLDEEGVEASAYTMIEVNEESEEGWEPEELPLVQITLDRPFLYGVFARDGTLLFTGVVRNPGGEPVAPAPEEAGHQQSPDATNGDLDPVL